MSYAGSEVCPRCGRDRTIDFHEDTEMGYRMCLSCNVMWWL